jgi:peroxiredoxin Q/BCP
MEQPAIGKQAPDFTLPDSSGETITLSALRGQPVVLYFYPKDNTSGCTQEGQDFRDLHARFKRAGALILGVSRDTMRSHARFREAQGFPFELLADTEETACQLYDVIKPRTMYGKPVRGIERSTFLIDAGGRLAREWRKVKVEGHAAEVLAAVKALKK